MTISINYKFNPIKKNSPDTVLFVDEKFNISSIKKYLKSSEYSFISDLIRSKDLKKKILFFDVSSKKKLF